MEPNVASLMKREVTMKTSSGTHQGTVGIIEENGIWITLAPGRPSPEGKPVSMNLKMFFPFAQMHWLATADR